VRVGVVDVGSNSTRLLIADVRDGVVRERERRSVVTRLGEGVDATGRLGEEPRERVLAVLAGYAARMDAHRCERRTAVLTSAVRDAANGREFADVVRERHGLGGRTLSGDEEARLTFLGATAARHRDDPVPRAVIDVGGGSTELVIGARGSVEFHVSMQAGVVRHSERHLASDPPRPEELESLAADVRAVLEDAVPAGLRERAGAAIATGGTATSCAAIDMGLEAPDADLVEGHVVTLERLSGQLSRMACVPLAERRAVQGLHPDRAATIVAGIVILTTVLRFLDLDAVEASRRDILWGVALDASA
jgi:exopolyphosphatase/guanosine-5'-triphosphate,3'-diphosphate pyrophosphatase